MRTQPSKRWVVYRVSTKGSAEAVNAVCSESEWAELELDRPGKHTLLSSGIESEAVAARLARGSSGDTVPSGVSRRIGPAAVAPQ